jgi:2-hydroxychromene-2-carboxylate isomerase
LKVYTPVSLGSILRQTSNTPPLAIHNKDAYTRAHLAILAKRFHLPLPPESPPGFPGNTSLIGRVLSVLARDPDTYTPDKIDADGNEYPFEPLLPLTLRALWEGYWGASDDSFLERSRLVEILTWVLRNEARAEELVSKGEEEEAKEMLKKETSIAVEKGAFGLPWMVARNDKGVEKGFFGVDHMGIMGDWLGRTCESEEGVNAWRALL